MKAFVDTVHSRSVLAGNLNSYGRGQIGSLPMGILIQPPTQGYGEAKWARTVPEPRGKAVWPSG